MAWDAPPATELEAFKAMLRRVGEKFEEWTWTESTRTYKKVMVEDAGGSHLVAVPEDTTTVLGTEIWVEADDYPYHAVWCFDTASQLVKHS